MPERERIGIFVNKTARPARVEQAHSLAERLPDSAVHMLDFPMQPIPDHIDTTIAIGGDGTARTIMENLHQRENPGVMVVIPGGSQNGIYYAMMDAKATLNVEQLQDRATDHVPLFKPGMIETVLFHHLADTGKAGTMHAEESEKLRGNILIPRQLKAHAGLLIALAKIDKSPDFPEFKTTSFPTSPYIGKYKVLPDRPAHSDTLTLAELRADNKAQGAAKLAAIMLYFIAKRKIPESLVEFTTQTGIDVPHHGGDINADGEILPPAKEGTIHVARSPKGLQVAALTDIPRR